MERAMMPIRWMVFVVALMGCATTNPGGRPGRSDPALVDPPPRAGAEAVLIVMPLSPDFMEMRRGLVSELTRSFNVVTHPVDTGATADELAGAITKHRPACLVLMNNETVTLFRDLQQRPTQAPLPPAVIVMTSFLEDVRPSLRNATGIAYEVPGVTAFTGLRSLMTAPLTRVGVVYRPMFRPFIERQRQMAQREQVELVAVEVPKEVSPAELEGALSKLLSSNPPVDALWMLNDNGLLRDATFIEDTWRAALRQRSVPLIVGVANLVDPRASLGAFAVVPDYEALGLQTANLIFDLADNDWRADEHDVELPLSVKTIIDLKQMRDKFGLRPGGVSHVDRVLE
jgi:hypothetical protein